MTLRYISNVTSSWTNAGTTYTGIGLNVTATGYAADSRPLNVRVNGTSVFSVDTSGLITSNTTLYSAQTANAAFAFANNLSVTSGDPRYAYGAANAAWSKANNALANTSGVSFNGDLFIPSGNVGIGLNSTTFKLDVSGAARIGYNTIQGNPNSTTLTTNAHTVLSGTGGNYLAFGQYDSTSTYAQWIQSAYVNPTTATYNLVLQPLGGNVGIGVTNPSGKLDVASRGITKGSMPAGSILQVQQTWWNGTATMAPSAFTDHPNLSVSITPSSSTSKILVMVSAQVTLNNLTVQTRFARNGTAIGVAAAASTRTLSTFGGLWPTADGNHQNYPICYQYLDSPGTTSALTYTFQIKTQGPGSTCYLNRSVNDADNTDWAQRTTSSITVMEIAA